MPPLVGFSFIKKVTMPARKRREGICLVRLCMQSRISGKENAERCILILKTAHAPEVIVMTRKKSTSPGWAEIDFLILCSR